MKIAVVGSGISGMGAAWLLGKQHQVTLYEKNSRIGGHTRTVAVEQAGMKIPVDTGFIVFNYRNYPNLSGLFKELEVPVQKSDMSFGASINDGRLEYGTKTLGSMFCQPRNMLSPQYWGMIRDIFRFNKRALWYLEDDGTSTLGECLDELKMGDWFRNYYLLPVGGSIWSCPPETMLDFPASSFIRFFHNHGLLTVSEQPQWYTVTGGSQEYVKRLLAAFEAEGGHIKIACGVRKVMRHEHGVTVHDVQNGVENYDQIVFAGHADESLALLEYPSENEQKLLGAFQFQPNRAVLHGDTSFMPDNKKAWSSWVYLLEGKHDHRPAISLSYWMNNLQNLPEDIPLLVTLNPGRAPDPALVYDEAEFHHPVFTHDAIAAQKKLDIIQGKRHSWFCGAWTRYGFHEDGLLSAVKVAESIGVDIPWK